MIPPLIKPFQKFGTKEMYQILIENNTKPACERRWSKALEINIPNKIWQEIYKLPFLIENTTLQWFQFRINHKILGTNLFLHKIGYKNSPPCNFCEDEPESIEHLFFDCIHIVFHIAVWACGYWYYTFLPYHLKVSIYC